MKNFSIKDVCVFIPTYNRPNFLRTSLNSLVKQTSGVPCITVFNNAGIQNETSEVIAEFADYGVREFRNQGGLFECMEYVSKSLRKDGGGFLCSSEVKYLMFFHDDDILNRKYLEYVITALNTYDDIALITTRTRVFLDEQEVDLSDANAEHFFFKNQWEFSSFVYLNEHVAMQTAIYKADVFLCFDRKSEKYGKFFDWPYLNTFAGQGNSIIFSDYRMFNVRRHKDQWTFEESSTITLTQLLNWHRSFYDAMEATTENSIGRQIFSLKLFSLFNSQYYGLVCKKSKKSYLTSETVKKMFENNGMIIDKEFYEKNFLIDKMKSGLFSENYKGGFSEVHLRRSFRYQNHNQTIYFFAPFYSDNDIEISSVYEAASILDYNNMTSKVICTDPIESYQDKELPNKYKSIFLDYICRPVLLNDNDVVVLTNGSKQNSYPDAKTIRWLFGRSCLTQFESCLYSSKEVLISYLKDTNNQLPQLFVLHDKRELFSSIKNKYGNHRDDTVCVYFGNTDVEFLRAKKSLFNSLRIKYKNIIILTRRQPFNYKRVLELIAKSSLLISFDAFSGVNMDSRILGTPVYIIDDFLELNKLDFSFKNDGLLYRLEDYQSAVLNVDFVFESYCKWLDNQNKALVGTIKNVIQKLFLIYSDPQAENLNAVLNHEVYNQTIKGGIANNSHRSFLQVNCYSDIPIDCNLFSKCILVENNNQHFESFRKYRVKKVLKNIIKAVLPISLKKFFKVLYYQGLAVCVQKIKIRLVQ